MCVGGSLGVSKVSLTLKFRFQNAPEPNEAGPLDPRPCASRHISFAGRRDRDGGRVDSYNERDKKGRGKEKRVDTLLIL